MRLDPMVEMVPGLFKEGNLPLLKKALDAYSLTQKVLSANVAQAETPGFRPSRVVFEELFAEETNPSTSLKLARTENNMLPPLAEEIPTPLVVESQPLASFSGDQNQVDIEAQMVQLADNALRYQLAVQILTRHYQLLQSAITGRNP